MTKENEYECGLYALAFVLIMGFAIVSTALESLGIIEGDRGREDDVEQFDWEWDRPYNRHEDHVRNMNRWPSAREANGYTN